VAGPLVFVLAAALAVSALLGPTPGAWADGDPASDVLYTRNVFLPYPLPDKASADALEQAVANAYAHHLRVKVAVIATPTDLGSVPDLFNKPAAYARYLGLELYTLFVGPLLIVMPSGFGIYDGGRSTAPEERVLASLTIGDHSARGLTRTAKVAVENLLAAGALRSKDIRAPSVFPDVATASPGNTARLRYAVVEDSERSREIIRIWSGTTLRATLRTRFHFAVAQKPVTVKWRVPRRLSTKKLRYCVTAIDPAGNTSSSACAQIVVIGG
jgi:hypothetical protein